MPYKDVNIRKLKHAEYSLKHYMANKEKALAANRAYRKQKREDWAKYKETLQCCRCGQNHPATLDFHHEDPSQKTDNVFKLVGNGQYKKALAEIEKCIVLCANCHRIHHYNEKAGIISPS